jgi:hypothetical protein
MWTDGRTDGQTERQTNMTKLIVAFRNFAKAHKSADVRIKIQVFIKRGDYAAGIFAPSRRP